MSENINFNELYERPPNFCDDCGDLLDFEIIKNNYIKCQRCDGKILNVLKLNNN
jgi:DNA-directed RNA polymerase subunit RPC12/RpoP